jgi:hypothetical protein
VPAVPADIVNPATLAADWIRRNGRGASLARNLQQRQQLLGGARGAPARLQLLPPPLTR